MRVSPSISTPSSLARSIAHDAAFGFVRFVGEGGRAAEHAAVDAVEAALGLRIDEQSGDEVHVIIAGRAGDVPIGAQAFVAEQDLLDHEIERLPERGRTVDEQVRIAAGIVEAVDVVDAQPLDAAVGDHGEHELVRAREHFRILHAQAGQIVDVEETPVVDLIRRHAPERGPVMLRGNQRIEPVRIADERRAAVGERARERGVRGHPAGEVAL